MAEIAGKIVCRRPAPGWHYATCVFCKVVNEAVPSDTTPLNICFGCVTTVSETELEWAARQIARADAAHKAALR